jgi:hypothetical protein
MAWHGRYAMAVTGRYERAGRAYSDGQLGGGWGMPATELRRAQWCSLTLFTMYQKLLCKHLRIPYLVGA